MDNALKRRRGRPLGFKLSDESKQAISDSKLGHIHNNKTKDRISGSLLKFYKDKYPLSSEMLEFYHRFYGEDAASWIAKNFEAIDDLTDVITDRAIYNFKRRELEFNTCFYKSSNSIDPEKLMDLKRILSTFDINVEDEDTCEVMCVLIDEMGLVFLLDDIRELLR